MILQYLAVLVVLVAVVPHVTGSEGDKLLNYRGCLNRCFNADCVYDKHSDLRDQKIVYSEKSWQKIEWAIWLLGWSCMEECSYKCMWEILQQMQKSDKNAVFKFYGRWPFYRFMGIQEPASALFSVFNLMAHLHMLGKLNRKFIESPEAPFKLCWRLLALVCINAWSWSTIFHTRDTPFTEFMDYACALSMVMAFFAAALIRILYEFWHPYLALVVITPALVYFAQHIAQLWSGQFNYDVNMEVNVTLGVSTGVMWLVFAAWCYWRWGRAASHVWRVAAFTVLSGALLTLELYDFPPVLGLVDAHALWHLTTAPLPYLFYRFLIDDIDFIILSKKLKEI